MRIYSIINKHILNNIYYQKHHPMKSKTKSNEYDHKKIEKKWQNIWEKKQIYRAKEDV